MRKTRTRKWSSRLSLFALLAALMMPLAACEQDGPAEEVGEEIDEAVDEVGDAVDGP